MLSYFFTGLQQHSKQSNVGNEQNTFFKGLQTQATNISFLQQISRKQVQMELELKDILKPGDIKVIDVLRGAANAIADKYRDFDHQYNFTYNAIRDHRQNISKYIKHGTKVGFFIYQEDFFDQIKIKPQFKIKQEIWSRRNYVGGKNYISVYFVELSAFKSHSILENVFSFKGRQSIEGVSYSRGDWKENVIEDKYWNTQKYGYFGEGWKALGKEVVDVDNYGAHHKYYTIIGYGYSFDQLRSQIPEGKCEIY